VALMPRRSPGCRSSWQGGVTPEEMFLVASNAVHAVSE
jgi:hypothetical protein